MKASDIIQDVTIRASSVGVDETVRATEQLARAGEAVVTTTDKVEKSLLDAGRAYDRLQREIDLNYRMQQNFERGQRTLDRALQQNKISTEAYDRSVGLLTAKYGPASLAADRFGASVKTSNANVGGIAAQFQDVAVQLAGGQSPFLIALQQGTQLSGQLEQTGGGVKALGAAFLSLFSPMSLLTIGGIAAFGMLVQYITGAVGQTETLDQRLEKHADVIRSIKTAYGEAAEGIDKYASESARVLDLQLRTVTEKVKAGVQQAAREIGAMTTTTIVPGIQFGIPEDLIAKTFEANAKFSAFKDAVVTLRQELDAGTVNIARFREEVARVASATTDTGVQKLASELLAMSENAFRAEQALGGSARAIGVLANAASSGLVALNGFNAALRTLQMGVPEMAKALTAQKDLTEANDNYRKGLADAKTAESAGGMTERAAAAATETYSRRVRDLNDAFQQRVRTITGANELEKDFGKTLETTVIGGLEGEARGIATARAAYEDRNQKIADSIKLGMSDAEATRLRAQNEKILAQELKNVAAANKDKGSGGGSSGGTDAFDTAIQRSRDQIEELKLQAEQASKTTAEVYRLTEAHKLRRAALSAGRSDEAGITDLINAQAEAYAKQKIATDQAIEGQRRYQESVRYTGDLLSTFVEDVLTGKLDAALKSIGKSFLSASVDALISGKGPLAGITGLAANDNKSQGGLLGVIAGLPKAVEKGAEKGAKYGSVDGIVTGIDIANGNGTGGLLGIDAKSLTGGLTAIAGLAGAYGVGASAGSMGQAAVGGALSGGMGGLALAGTGIGASLGGAAVLGPIGAAIGIGLAVYGKQQADKQRKEELRKQAEANYQSAKGDIATFRSEARGEPQDTLAKRIADAETTARKLADVAYLSGRAAEANAIWADGQIYVARAIGEYRDGFAGLLDAMNSGLGPNSPFATAKDQIKSFGQELNTFVANTKTAFGETSIQVQMAREAAAQYALTVLNGSRSLSVVEQRMAEIEGTGAGLVKVLTDLGWESGRAADAVREGMTAALQRVRQAFEGDYVAKTNEAQGKGYLNDAANLIAELASARTGAAAIGADQGIVTAYFKAAAQEIVDGAQLSGDAFSDLLFRFPELIGNVNAFEEAVDTASKAAEIAARRLSAQDRLFAAVNDTTTLAGQLAAFDRSALREREAEIKAGGEAMNDLEAAFTAERLNIVRDFNQQALDDQKRVLDEAENYADRIRRSITQYLDGLRSGNESPLSPSARLAAAQSQFSTQLALAQGGDRNALDGITGSHGDLLEAAKAMYASSAQYQAIFAQSTAELAALPDQVSPEQLIVDAIEESAANMVSSIEVLRASLKLAVESNSPAQIAAALYGSFGMIDTSLNGLLDYNEIRTALQNTGLATDGWLTNVYNATNAGTNNQEARLAQIFGELDTNGDGQLSKLELIRGQAASTASTSATTAGNTASTVNYLDWLRVLSESANSLANWQGTTLDQVRENAYWQAELLGQIRALTDYSAGTLNALNSQFSNNNSISLLGNTLNNNMREALNKIVFNTAMGVASAGAGAPYALASGGWVSGPGSSTSDSIPARLSNGEFVVKARAASMFGPALEMMNDSLRMPTAAMPFPVARNGGGGSDPALLAEIRALRASNERLEQQVAALAASNARGHERTADAVEEQTDAVKADTRKATRPGLAGRGAKVAA